MKIIQSWNNTKITQSYVYAWVKSYEKAITILNKQQSIN